MTARAPLRVALNLAIDGAMGALAVPVARAIAAPAEAWLNPPWLLALGAVTLLLAGLPLRLPWQYWRFAGISDLVSVAGASVLGAALFAVATALTGTASANFAFPAVHALVLLVLLGTPRVAYRLLRHQRRGALPAAIAPGLPSSLVV